MTGLALALVALADLVIVYSISHRRYGVKLYGRALKVFMIQLPLVIASWAVSYFTSGVLFWVAGVALLVISTAVSFHYLRKHTSFIRSLSDRISKKIHK
jgi:hypothetical protein